ncbi:MAG: fibronectin type III domain-containing protein, partial [Gammaproteobacteria bacterium]
NVFSDLTNLMTLELHSNALTTLPENAFSGLTNLMTLELHSNALTTLPVGAFTGLYPGLTRISGITLPSAPVSLTLTAAERSIVAAWPAVSGAHYYLSWKRADADAYAPADAVALSAITHTIPNLSPTVRYDVRVAALFNNPTQIDVFDDGGLVPLSWTFTSAQAGVPASKPDAPQNLTATPDNVKILAAWDAPADNGGAAVLTYQLRWKEAGSAEFAPGNAVTTAADTTAYTITSINNGTTYLVQVAAQNTVEIGDYAETQATPRTIPDAPTAVQVENGAGFLKLTWTAPADTGGNAITSYAVQWAEGAGSTTWIGSGENGSAAAAYTLGGLKGATTYEVQVAARNDAGRGAWSATSAQGVTTGFDLDVDSSGGGADWQDGVMIARYLAGVRGPRLVTGMRGSPNAVEVASKIGAGVKANMLNVDGTNGTNTADGIMIARYMLGVKSGPALTDGMTRVAVQTVIDNIGALPGQ